MSFLTHCPSFRGNLNVTSSTSEKAWQNVHCSPYCDKSKNLYPCDLNSLCPICHNKNIRDPIYQKFGKSYSKAAYWYAFTFSYELKSSDARLRFITKRDSKGNPVNPYVVEFESPPKRFRKLNELDVEALKACGRIPFTMLKWICGLKRLQFGGALGGLDLWVGFQPVDQDGVDPSFLVHVHAIANSSRALTSKDASRIYNRFCVLSTKAKIPMCPDLEISLLKTEEDFQRWLNYTLKPMKFEEFYRKGASACSDRPQVFNDVFDQTVFGYPEFVYNGVRSPRYYGNMQQRSKDRDSFIGVWQYGPTLNDKDFKRIQACKGEGVSPEELARFEAHQQYKRQQNEHRKARKEQSGFQRGRRRQPVTKSSSSNFDKAKAAIG